MKHVFAIIFVCLFIQACGAGQGKHGKLEDDYDFQLQVMQNNMPVTITDNSVVLTKSEFDLNIAFKRQLRLLINIHHEPGSYHQANSGVPVDKIIGYTGTGLAEARFNKGRDIMPRKKYPNMWYYQNEKDHRFNGVKVGGSGVECKRTVRNIFTEDRKTIGIEEYDHDNLYFVFVSYRYDAKLRKKIEYKRRTLKIGFK